MKNRLCSARSQVLICVSTIDPIKAKLKPARWCSDSDIGRSPRSSHVAVDESGSNLLKADWFYVKGLELKIPDRKELCNGHY